MEEMIFADGMGFKPRHEKAPETVRGTIYFNAQKFSDFLQKHKDEKGWVNTKMMKSKKDGSIYFILDTWKPTPTVETQKETQEYNDTKYQTSHATGRTSPTAEHPEGLSIEDIGF